MKRRKMRGFDEHLDESLRKSPSLAKEYFRQLTDLPLATQLAILRTHQGFTQSEIAKSLRVKQPHIARAERADHDSKLSSIEAQVRAIRCRLMIVPDKYVSMVCDKIDYTDPELGKIKKLVKSRGGKPFKSGRATKRMRGFLKEIDTAVKREKDRLAPVGVSRQGVDWTEAELDKIERLAKAPGRKSFKTARAAMAYLKSL